MRAHARSAIRARCVRASLALRSVRTSTTPVVEPVAGRWPWSSVSRSRIAVGRWHASSILRVSSRALVRSAPLPTISSSSQLCSFAAAAAAAARESSPAAASAAHGVRIDLCPRCGGGQREAGGERRDVADGVAPRAVDERRRQHGVGVLRRLRLGPGGDEPRGRPGGSRRTQRLRRRPGAALVRDADHGAAVLRLERCLERLARDRGDPGLAQDLGDAQRRVLARAAADDRQRPVPAAEQRQGGGIAAQLRGGGDALDQGGLGLDHLLHHPRRGGAQLGEGLGVVPVFGHVEIALSVSVAGSSRPPRCSARNSSAAAWNARLFSGLRNPCPSSANSM